MQYTTIVLTALMSFALATDLPAQDIPDFSGTWARVSGGGAEGGAGLAGLGESATITQTDSTLTLVRTTQFGRRTSVYNLDGSNRNNTLTLGDFSMPQRTSVSWTDGALLIRTTTDVNGNPVETTMRLTLNDAGQLTVVATSSGTAGGGASEETSTYERS